MFRSFVVRIQRGLRRSSVRQLNEKNVVPNDVREGYFAVHAVKDGETKRFIVELEYLKDPSFMVLLEQAQEEFGLRQKGALSVPCTSQELQNILQGGRRRRWSAC